MRIPGPPHVYVTLLSVKWVQRASSLWVPGGCSLLGTEFLYVLLCLRVCVVLPPGQPGVWGIGLSTAELG